MAARDASCTSQRVLDGSCIPALASIVFLALWIVVREPIEVHDVSQARCCLVTIAPGFVGLSTAPTQDATKLLAVDDDESSTFKVLYDFTAVGVAAADASLVDDVACALLGVRHSLISSRNSATSFLSDSTHEAGMSTIVR